jgi:glycosyltransferase involved in cell wall biosynthesis
MPLETRLLRRFSRRLVFDFDDAIYARHESRGAAASVTREFKTRAVLKRADLVIVGNAHLQAYAAARNRNVRILPSCVEVRGLPVRDHERRTGPVVIGWVGGKVNLPQLALLAPVLQDLARIRAIELHVVCDQGLEMPGVTVRHVPWTLETQDAAVAGFDIGVMPLPDSEHARGKCGYKAIQCMAARVPVVVSDVGFNRELVADGVDGFRAATPADFERPLLALIDSPGVRAQLGARARDKVERLYAVEPAARTLAAMLEAL